MYLTGAYLLGMIFLVLADDASFDNWVAIGVEKGVEQFMFKKSDSAAITVKGRKLLPFHISQIMGSFNNASIAHLWVDKLSSMREYDYIRGECSVSPSSSDGSFKDFGVVHQVYGLPWPVKDRDFVLFRKFNYNEKLRTIVVDYESVNDTRLPVCDRFVRAHSNYSRWYFEAKEGGSTLVEVETMIDMKGSLPVFLINILQRSWPSNTILSLENLVSLSITAPLARVSKW